MQFSRISAALAASLAIAACGGGGSGSSAPPSPPAPPPPPPPVDSTVLITGSAEKGPFVAGSQVEVRAVPATGVPGDVLLTTSVDDAVGRFDFETEPNALIQITVSGQYGSELDGQVSAAVVSLRALIEVSNESNQVAQVNVLTHLATERALALMRDNGLSSGTALAQARDEVLSALEAVTPRPEMGLFSEIGRASGRERV